MCPDGADGSIFRQKAVCRGILSGGIFGCYRQWNSAFFDNRWKFLLVFGFSIVRGYEVGEDSYVCKQVAGASHWGEDVLEACSFAKAV